MSKTERNVTDLSDLIAKLEKAAITQADALYDSAYIAGAKAGYNLGLTENHEGLATLVGISPP